MEEACPIAVKTHIMEKGPDLKIGVAQNYKVSLGQMWQRNDQFKRHKSALSHTVSFTLKKDRIS